jgi:hypothetical protein
MSQKWASFRQLSLETTISSRLTLVNSNRMTHHNLRYSLAFFASIEHGLEGGPEAWQGRVANGVRSDWDRLKYATTTQARRLWGSIFERTLDVEESVLE